MSKLDNQIEDLGFTPIKGDLSIEGGQLPSKVEADSDLEFVPENLTELPSEPIEVQGVGTVPIKRDIELDLRPTFDPGKEMSKQISGSLEAVSRGALQASTLGFADEIAALVEGGVPYEQALQEVREAYARAQEEHPLAYGVGTGIGTVAPLLTGPGRVAVSPITSILSRVAPGAGKLARIGAATSESALIGGVAGAGMAEGDKLEGAESGAEMGALVGGGLTTLAHALPLATKIPVIGELPTKAFKRARKTGLIPGVEDLTETLSQIKSTEKEIADLLEEGLSKKLLPQQQERVLKVGEDITDLIKSTKSKYGQQIGSTVEKLVNEGNPIVVKDIIDDTIDQIKKARFGGDAKRKAEDIIEELTKLKEIPAQKPINIATTEKLKRLADSGEEATELLPAGFKVKIGRKEGTKEELERLLRVGEKKPAGVDIVRKYSDEGLELGREITEKGQIKFTPTIKEAISPEEAIEAKRYLAREAYGRTQPEKELTGITRKAYRQIVDRIEEQLPEGSEELKLFKQAKDKYSKAIEAEGLALEEGRRGLEPTSKLLRQLEKSSGQLSVAEKAELDSLFKTLSDIDPTAAKSLQEEVISGSKDLAETKKLISKYLESATPAPGPGMGARRFPEIEEGIISAEARIVDPTRRKFPELLGAMSRASPEKTRKLLPKIREAAEAAELTGQATEDVALSRYGVTPSLIKRAAIQSGGLAGKFVKSLAEQSKDVVKNTAQVIGKIGVADPVVIEDMANFALAKGRKGLSNLLTQSLGKDRIGRNAALFLITQDPILRKQAQDTIDELSGDLGNEVSEE